MEIEEKCVYCGVIYLSNGKGEHVFPFGLGGANLYMDCVCAQCNNYFSSLERELLQTSLIGMMRSVEGIQGYKNYEYPAPFKAQLLLMPGRNNEIIYEVGQFEKMQIFVRPQIIAIKDKFYLEGSSSESIKKFSELFIKWKTKNLKMITNMPLSKGDHFGCVEFKQVDNLFSSEITTDVIKIKSEILFDALPESYEHYNSFTPRIYIDDDEKLRVRAAKEEDAIQFLGSLLAATLVPLKLNSFGEADIIEPVINVGYSFDILKFDQALVKIGINCLLHYFPAVKNAQCLNDYISFVMTGKTNIRKGTEEKNTIIDSLEDTHNIFFHQAADFLRLRISLFNGSYIFAIYMPNSKILNIGEYNRLVIRYKNRSHVMQSRSAFLESFK